MKPRYAMIAAHMLVAATMVQAPQAWAQDPPSQDVFSATTATGSCQGSLSTYEASLRKRPLAIENEGPASVFISCSSQFGYQPGDVVSAGVIAANWTDVAVELTCTLVDGPSPDLALHYTKTATLGPLLIGEVGWLPSEYGRTTFSGYENFSCNVPPGVEINLVGFFYEP